MLPEGWQELHLRSVERIAGPRFDPALDVNLDFASVFDGFGRTRKFRDALAAVGNKLGAVFSHGIGDDAPDALAVVHEATRATSKLLANASLVTSHDAIDFREIAAAARSGMEAAWGLRSQRAAKEPEGDKSRVSDYLLHDVNKAADLLGEAVDLCGSMSGDAANRQLLLVKGAAGSGKTHLLLHVARQRWAEGLSTIVLFGDRFSGLAHIQEAGARQGLGRRYSLPEMLDELEEIGRASGSRSLLLIDAINETSPCAVWQEGLRWIEDALATHPHVAVALTFRDGFENAIATQEQLARHLVVEHPGFAQNLWAAVHAFFSYYQVQWPEIPLLGPEFMNPLFLKLFSTARDASELSGARGRHAHLRGVRQEGRASHE